LKTAGTINSKYALSLIGTLSARYLREHFYGDSYLFEASMKQYPEIYDIAEDHQ